MACSHYLSLFTKVILTIISTCLLRDSKNFFLFWSNNILFNSGDTGRILRAGQCNQEDKEIWDSKNKEVKNALDSCGMDCWGAAKCTEKCMMEKTELSTKCADCFGSFAGCGKSNCLWKCIFGKTEGCIKCVKEYCVDGFVKCSGLSSPF